MDGSPGANNTFLDVVDSFNCLPTSWLLPFCKCGPTYSKIISILGSSYNENLKRNSTLGMLVLRDPMGSLFFHLVSKTMSRYNEEIPSMK